MRRIYPPMNKRVVAVTRREFDRVDQAIIDVWYASVYGDKRARAGTKARAFINEAISGKLVSVSDTIDHGGFEEAYDRAVDAYHRAIEGDES